MCNLSKQSCKTLAPVFQNADLSLKELDLSNNDLQDSGVKLISAGLKDSNCKLEKLGLSGCMVTKEGCSSLASALISNPSHLKELDLTYNHPGLSMEERSGSNKDLQNMPVSSDWIQTQQTDFSHCLWGTERSSLMLTTDVLLRFVPSLCIYMKMTLGLE
ncbi:hypothetical protein NFI96_007490 [Prochilodus magdalenae]|nr:hypothetical protein NFI96_007490 [Prochilodus magdalenae]